MLSPQIFSNWCREIQERVRLIDIRAIAALVIAIICTLLCCSSSLAQTPPSSGQVLWLKADTGVTESGGLVSTWADQSGNSNDATQSTSARRPTLVSNAINGLPAISFDNVTQQFLTLPTSSFSNLSSGISIFAVLVPGPGNSVTRLINFANGADNTDHTALLTDTNDRYAWFFAYNGSTGSNLQAASSLTVGQAQMLEVVHDGAGNAKIYVNAVQGASGSVQNLQNTSRSHAYIGQWTGGGYFFNGQIAELIVYNRGVNSTERGDIEAYFENRYAISSIPPTISPNLGVFSGNRQITLSAAPQATIRYTLDGSTPTGSSTLYTSPFTITESKTIKAIAIQSLGTSDVASAYIQIDPNTANVSRTGLQLWLKADNDVFTSGSDVTSWYDMSGNNMHATGSSAKPSFVSSAVNSLPAVEFDSTSSEFMQLPTGFSSFTGGAATAFVVVKPVSTVPTGATLFNFGSSSSDDDIGVTEPTSTGARFRVFNGSSESYVDSGSALTAGTFKLLEVMQSGSSVGSILTDGVLGAQGVLNNVNSVSRNSNFLGKWRDNSGYFNGQIAEILFYNRALTASERSAVEGYLSHRYHLAVPPPLITPSSGVFSRAQDVAIAGAPDATIRYTNDGTTPTGSSTAYTAGFNITTSKVIKAIQVQSWGISPVSASYIQIDHPSILIPRSGLSLWLKGDFGRELNSSLVSKWADLSGNDNHFEQTTGANQPGSVSSAQNGLPGVSFNGSDEFLQNSRMLTSFSAGASAFVVMKPSTLTTNATIFDLGNGTASDNISLQEPDTSGGIRFNVYSGASGSNVDGSSALTAGIFNAQEIIHNGSGTATLYANGIQTGTGSINNIATLTRSSNFIGQKNGGTNFFPGTITEILLWNRPLTQAERASARAYLIQKYQLLGITPDAPVMSVDTATLTAPTQVAISCENGATCYFTVDGSTPTTSSTVYSKPINVYYTQTLKAICVKNGISSSVASETYTLNSTNWPAPNPSDMTPLDIDLLLPPAAVPQ